MNITGNMKQLLMDIAETGNDVNKNSSLLAPSIVFNNVDFSGI
jgi:PmbA protein